MKKKTTDNGKNGMLFLSLNFYLSLFSVYAKWKVTFAIRLSHYIQKKKWSKWYANNKVIHLTFLMKILPNEKIYQKHILLSERMWECIANASSQQTNTRKSVHLR